MKTLRRTTCALMLASCAFTSAVSGPQPLALNDVISVDLDGVSFWAAQYANGTKALTSGYVYYEPPQLQAEEMPKLILHVASTTAHAALDTITRLDGSYSWSDDGSVIVFLPKKRNKKFLDPIHFLNQVVPIFSVKDVSFTGAVHELEAQAIAQGLKGFRLDPGNTPEARAAERALERQFEDAFSLELKGRTVRECLNAIAKTDPPSHWIVAPYPTFVFIGVNASHSHSRKQVIDHE